MKIGDLFERVVGVHRGLDAGGIADNWDERSVALTGDFEIVHTKPSKSPVDSKRFCDDPAALIFDATLMEVKFP